jgi:hypothetical protein
MDNDLLNQMVDTLKEAIVWAEEREGKLLAEVLSIESKINNIQ